MVVLAASVAAQQPRDWEQVSSMPGSRYGASVVVYHDQIWVIGGFDENGMPTNTVSIYDPAADFWGSNGRSLQIARANAAAVVHQDTIFVIGGQDSSGLAVATVEAFHPFMKEWIIHSKLNSPRESLTAVSYRKTMYAIGGLSYELRNLAEVEAWNATRHQWEQINSWKLSLPRLSMASLVADDAVYTLGGIYLDPVNLVERYTPEKGVERVAPLPAPRYNFAAVAVQDTIFVIGGETIGVSSVNVISSIHKYIINTNTWIEEKSSLNVNRFGLSAVYYWGFVYIFGGRQFNALDASVTASSQVFRLPVGYETTSVIQPTPAVAGAFELLPNYPNPFNTSTTLSFSVQKPVSNLKLEIVNVAGRRVKMYQWLQLAPGVQRVQWDGTNDRGQSLASGVYMYRLVVKGHVLHSRKLLLLR